MFIVKMCTAVHTDSLYPWIQKKYLPEITSRRVAVHYRLYVLSYTLKQKLHSKQSVTGLEPVTVSLAVFYIAALHLFSQGISLASNFLLRRIKNSTAETFEVTKL